MEVESFMDKRLETNRYATLFFVIVRANRNALVLDNIFAIIEAVVRVV